MEKAKYKISKTFSPLDDLYGLLQLLEETLGTEIDNNDYIIGRKQLYYIFLHETIHAFITKKARWIHELKEDETDFVDEAAVRIIIDDVIKRLNIFNKMDVYYEHHVNHKIELKNYGYHLDEEEYKKLEEKWFKDFSKENDIDGFCKFLLKYYRENFGKIGRDKNFKY